MKARRNAADDRPRRPRSGVPVGALIALACLTVLAIVVVQKATVKTVRVVVTEARDGWVQTDQGRWRNVNSWTFTKLDSPGLEKTLSKGGRFECKVPGVRVPKLSAERNLLSCKPLDPPVDQRPASNPNP